MDFPDFTRLSRGLRAMKYDFAKPHTVLKKADGGETVYVTNPDAIVADDVQLEEATLLTSRHKYGRAKSGGKGMHRVVLDIDHDAALIPSTTPGHFHLMIDVTMEFEKYEKLLTALAAAGIIEQGYANASIARGYSAIRPPWEKKLPSAKMKVTT